MAHEQKKPNFIFPAKCKGQFKTAVWRQFSRLLEADVFVSAVVVLNTACSEVV